LNSPAELRRRVGLQVERVEVALPAVQEDEDQRHIFVRLRFLFRPEQLRQAERSAEEARGADADRVAPRDAVAEGGHVDPLFVVTRFSGSAA
jgi:hypothetical protein